MLNFKRATLLVIIFTLISILNVFGYTGVLDEFQGYDYSAEGNWSVDSFKLSDSDLYVKICIDDSGRWGGGTTAGMYVQPGKKNSWGVYKVQASKSFTKAPGDSTYEHLDFTELSTGTYKIHFKSYYSDSVDFSGTVYDND